MFKTFGEKVYDKHNILRLYNNLTKQIIKYTKLQYHISLMPLQTTLHSKIIYRTFSTVFDHEGGGLKSKFYNHNSVGNLWSCSCIPMGKVT